MKKSFTLIELLIVIVIVGILAALAAQQYERIVEMAKGQEAIIVINAIYDFAQLYHIETGNWPPDAWDTNFAEIEKSTGLKLINNGDWFFHINGDPFYEVYAWRKKGKWENWSLGKWFRSPKNQLYHYCHGPRANIKTTEVPPWTKDYSGVCVWGDQSEPGN